MEEIQALLTDYFNRCETAVLLEGEEGRVLYANPRWQKFVPEDGPLLPPGFGKRLQAAKENRFLLKQDACFFAVACTPLSKPGHFLWQARDVTEQEKTKRQCYAFKTILDNVDEAVIMTDADDIIRLYNKAHEILDEKKAGETLGQRVDQIYREQMHTKVRRKGSTYRDLYHRYLLNDGKVVNTLSSTIPLTYGDELLGVYSISRNIPHTRNLMIGINEMVQQGKKGPTGKTNGTRYTFDHIIGESIAIQETKADAKRMAMSHSPLMIYGETGTGKELFAQSIHNASLYCEEPFVAINCAAVPENLMESLLFGTTKGSFTGAENAIGLLEQAGKGTFFLDEINAMPLSMQSKLLRVLQERCIRKVGGAKEIPIHCRIISACNQPPEQCVKEGLLRLDLFYRLAVLRINIPALRNRGGDVLLLAKYFTERIGSAYHIHPLEFSDDFLRYLARNSWPGNVRQLEFTIEATIVSAGRSGVLKTDDIPNYMRTEEEQESHAERRQKIPGAMTLKDVLLSSEKEAIEHALNRNHGNISQSARDLGIGRQNLQYRIKKLRIQPSQE